MAYKNKSKPKSSARSFKPCSSCPNPAACRRAGKCAKKSSRK